MHFFKYDKLTSVSSPIQPSAMCQVQVMTDFTGRKIIGRMNMRCVYNDTLITRHTTHNKHRALTAFEQLDIPSCSV